MSTLRSSHSARPRQPTHELRLEQILKFHLDRRNRRAHVRRLNLKHPDLVRAQGQADLVELLGRELIDRKQDTAVVQCLS